MKNKINIAELLEDCPKGMELYSPIFGEVYLDKIRPHLSIVVTTNEDRGNIKEEFFYDGRYGINGECMLFPSKGKTTWEGFVPSCKFKDGDVISVIINKTLWYGIYKKEFNTILYCHVSYSNSTEGLYPSNEAGMCKLADIEEIRLATEEEKQVLFDIIKANGFKWNSKTKTLDKLIKPIFKVGNRISLKCENLYWDIKAIVGDWYICNDGSKIHIGEQHQYELVLNGPKFKVGNRVKCIHNGCQYDITELTDTHYTLIEVIDKFIYTVHINEDKNWELVPSKFDISNLKPFDRVLVRTDNKHIWSIQFFEKFNNSLKDAKFVCMGRVRYRQCIPYKGNEHLHDTANDCDDFYKTWEK